MASLNCEGSENENNSPKNSNGTQSEDVCGRGRMPGWERNFIPGIPPNEQRYPVFWKARENDQFHSYRFGILVVRRNIFSVLTVEGFDISQTDIFDVVFVQLLPQGSGIHFALQGRPGISLTHLRKNVNNFNLTTWLQVTEMVTRQPMNLRLIHAHIRDDYMKILLVKDGCVRRLHLI